MSEAQEHFNAGVEAYNAGDIDKAVEELETATQLDNTDHKSFIYLGAAYAAKGRYNAAIGAFKMADQIMPSIPSTYYNIGQAYEAAGMLEDAEYEYNRAVRLDPTYTNANEALARIRKKLAQ